MKKVKLNQRMLTTLFIIFGASLGLSACSNSESSKPKSEPQYKTIQTMNQQQKVELGMVVAVRNVPIQQNRVNPYGNIGVAASSGGFRGIYGSVDLGTLSRLFKKTTAAKMAQEIIVKKQNGPTVAITQVAKESFKKGDVVKILVRNGQAQVIH